MFKQIQKQIILSLTLRSKFHCEEDGTRRSQASVQGKRKKHYKLKAQARTEDPAPNLDELRTFSQWRDLYELFPSNHAVAHGDVFRS